MGVNTTLDVVLITDKASAVISSKKDDDAENEDDVAISVFKQMKHETRGSTRYIRGIIMFALIRIKESVVV